MDLYIQVGVILLFMAALSLFIYLYTLNGSSFNRDMSDVNSTVQSRLTNQQEQILNSFNDQTDVTGAELKSLIRDAKSNKIAVFVSSKVATAVSMYGYRLETNGFTTNSSTIQTEINNLSYGDKSAQYLNSRVVTEELLFGFNFVNSIFDTELSNSMDIKQVTRQQGNRLLFDKDNTNANRFNVLPIVIAPHMESISVYGAARPLPGGHLTTVETRKLYSPGFVTDKYISNNMYEEEGYFKIEDADLYHTVLVVNYNDEPVGVYAMPITDNKLPRFLDLILTKYAEEVRQ